MDLGFRGEVAEFYHRYRHGYPAEVIDVLTDAFRLTELTLDQIVGGLYSAMPVARLPAPGQRSLFAGQVRAALAPHQPFAEQVQVAMLFGRLR
jgi:hypothetical protein